MKTLQFTALLMLATVGPIAADDLFRVVIGRESDRSSADLARRVTFLERAVYQMQERVFNLEAKPVSVVAPSTFTTCYIKTPFNGTFTATEPTEMAARANTMKKCSDGGGDIHCRESDLKCGH